MKWQNVQTSLQRQQKLCWHADLKASFGFSQVEVEQFQQVLILVREGLDVLGQICP